MRRVGALAREPPHYRLPYLRLRYPLVVCLGVVADADAAAAAWCGGDICRDGHKQSAPGSLEPHDHVRPRGFCTVGTRACVHVYTRERDLRTHVNDK